MRKFIKFLSIVIGFSGIFFANAFVFAGSVSSVSSASSAGDAANTSNQSQRIEKLIQQKQPHASVGIFVQDAKTGKILYERRAEENFLPASTAKLVTASASLYLLGPEFQYETAFKTKVKRQEASGLLNGDLYLILSGDPSFTIENLEQLIKDLKTAGIKQIKGNIIIDDTLFKGKPYPYGWMADDLAWYYAAPITTVIINENRVKLSLQSNKTLGEKAVIALASDEKMPIKLSQDVISVTETEAKENCELSLKMDQNNNLDLKGCWPAKEKEDELKVAVQNPNFVLQQLLKQILKTENIAWSGKIIFGPVPASAQRSQEMQTIALHQSLPLKTLLKTVLQDSNNLYTESLVKRMGVKQSNEGTFQAGLRAIKGVLNSQFGIDVKTLRLQDGSGDSRYDALSPAQLGRVLYVMYHNPDLNTIFQENLANSGNSGTLKKRMESFDLNGIIKAKTGTMTGVSGLAGYMMRPEKDDLIFVILINGIVADTADAKQLENELSRIFSLDF